MKSTLGFLLFVVASVTLAGFFAIYAFPAVADPVPNDCSYTKRTYYTSCSCEDKDQRGNVTGRHTAQAECTVYEDGRGKECKNLCLPCTAACGGLSASPFR